MKYISFIRQSFQGAWVITGVIGTKQYMFYSKQAFNKSFSTFFKFFSAPINIILYIGKQAIFSHKIIDFFRIYVLLLTKRKLFIMVKRYEYKKSMPNCCFRTYRKGKS